MSYIEAKSNLSQAYLIVEAENVGEVLPINSEEKLYSQGGEADALYIVKSGLIYTSQTKSTEEPTTGRPRGQSRTIIDGIFRSGSIVGAELFEEDRYKSTAVSSTNAEVITLDKEKLFLMFMYNPVLIAAVGNILTAQINEAEQHEVLLNRGTAKQRVRKAVEDFNYNGYIVANQFMLSDRAGMVREEFNRTLHNKKKSHRSVTPE